MLNRHTRERKGWLALVEAAVDGLVTDRQLTRERWHTAHFLFKPMGKRRKKAFLRLAESDRNRRRKLREDVLEEVARGERPELVPNRAQRRAAGDRGHTHGFGRSDIPRGKPHR